MYIYLCWDGFVTCQLNYKFSWATQCCESQSALKKNKTHWSWHQYQQNKMTKKQNNQRWTKLFAERWCMVQGMYCMYISISICICISKTLINNRNFISIMNKCSHSFYCRHDGINMNHQSLWSGRIYGGSGASDFLCRGWMGVWG